MLNMNTLIPSLVVCCAVTTLAPAQVAQPWNVAGTSPMPVAPGTDYVVVERGPHHRVLSRVVWERDPAGNTVARTNSYYELCTGMHYLDGNGQWAESKEEIDAYPGGAVAQYEIGRAHV